MSVTLLFALAASFAELALWTAVTASYVPVGFAFALHLLLSVVLAANFFTLKRERASILLLAAGTLFMGPFGTVGGVAMALYAFLPSKSDFQTYRRSLGPDGDDDILPAPHLVRGSEGTLISFHDVMRWGTRSEKQTALRRMAERYSPAFASVLKMAMRDNVPEIRSEASAATNAILKQLESKARGLSLQTQNPDRFRRGRNIFIAYGDAEMAVSQSGLASLERAAKARTSALAAYREAVVQMPQNAELRLKVAQALFDDGDLVEAARQTQGVLSATSTLGEPDGDVLATHLESLFALGRYADIRRTLAQVPAGGKNRRAALLWKAPAVAVSPAPQKKRHA